MSSLLQFSVLLRTFLRWLRRISARAGRRVVVIIDNAKYHHATLHAGWVRLQEPDCGLHFLPPYTPELNPVARAWKLLRRLWLHNRFLPSLQELIEIVDAQFKAWARPNPVPKRLCSLKRHAH